MVATKPVAAIYGLFGLIVAPLATVSAQHHLSGLALPVDPAPNGKWYGSGCGGAQGQSVTISIDPPMRPGLISTMQIEHLPPFQPAMLIFGSDHRQWWGLPLPAPLDGLGMTGCQLLCGNEVSFMFATGTGTALANFRVPTDPWLAAEPLYSQVMFHQTGASPVNVGASRGYATRVTPFSASSSMVSSITQHGITFQFESPVRAGRFVNGDWFVVGPVRIKQMLPLCTTVGGRVINGAMVDPDPSTQNQGYDSELFDPQHYHHSRNAAWGLSASNPLQLQPGQAVIKSISNQNPAYEPELKTCSVLTVLGEVPPNNSFRPPYAGTDRRVRYDRQMVAWGRLRDLLPSPGMPDFATYASEFRRPWLDHAPGWASRYMHPTDNMPDYGRDFAALYNEAVLMCNTDAPLSVKRDLAVHLIQIGIDFFANVEGGAMWQGVGGHGSGRKWPILFAGQLLGDEDMLAVGVNYPSVRNLNGTFTTFFGEDSQTFYVQQTSPTEINWGHGGYTTADIGLPEFGISHVHSPQQDVKAWLGDPYRRCCTANAWIGAVLGARIMGLRDEWNHPALFDYTDRYVAIEQAGWTMSWKPWVGLMWDQYRPDY